MVSTAERRAISDKLARYNPEPIIAMLEEMASARRRDRLREVISQRLAGVTMVMDAPHDPHNGAAVLRSCDAFGVSRVHVVQRAHAFVASAAVSKGAERWVNVSNYTDPKELIAMVRGGGYQLIGTHPQGELLPEQLQSIPRVALVMGNEHDGICEALSAACDDYVRVPMRGYVESLNVSVTAAILLAYATRDRPGDLPPEEQRRLYAEGLILSVPRALDILSARGLNPLEA